MIRAFREVAPGRIRLREGGGCMALFGASHQLCDIIDVDYSTAESLLGSARQHAAQSVMQSRGPRPAGPTIGPRTARVFTVLSQFAKGRVVTLKTKHGLTSFGQGLSDDEIAYLYSVVRRALV